MNILIYGIYPDIHTEAVAWGLRQKGAHVDIWYQGNFPALQSLSVHVSGEPERPHWHLRDFSLEARSTPYDVVWYRRQSEPTIADIVHENDRQMAFHESFSLLSGMDILLGQSAVQVNQPASNWTASNKVFQLQQAAACGLRVPATLFSNDPAAIRRFVAEQGDVVYKAFYQAHWRHEPQQGMRSLFTRRVQPDQLHNDAALAACPGIFQRRIEKQHEIRLTLMGSTALAVKIDAYSSALAESDWRAASNGGVRYEQVTVPQDVLDKSLALMRSLGIAFGCLDFIVDKSGSYHFLEVNPSGQFLWVEAVLPQSAMLDAFCNFLLQAGAPGTDAGPRVSMLEFQQWRAEAGEADSPAHVVYKNPFAYFEASHG